MYTHIAGLARRVKEFEYDKATTPEIDRLVEESAVVGGRTAETILQLVLAETDEDLSWTYGSASPAGQSAEVGRAVVRDDDGANVPDEDFLSGITVYGALEPPDSSEAPGEFLSDEEGPADLDLDDVGDYLDSLQESLSEPPASETAHLLQPGEAEVY
jgi:hypothetical protein